MNILGGSQKRWNIQMIPRTSDNRYLIGNVVVTLRQCEIVVAILNNAYKKNSAYAADLSYQSAHTFRKTLQVVYGKFETSNKVELQQKVLRLLQGANNENDRMETQP